MTEWNVGIKTDSLMDYMGCRNLGLILDGIFMSDVALVALFSCEDKIVEIDRLKECVARILRFLSGYSEEFGFILPVLGLIYVDEKANAEVKNKINQWAADQDWHRGDFSIVVLTDSDKSKNVEDYLNKVLGAPSTAWKQLELKPRDIKDIISSIQSKMRALESSAEHESLISAILQVLEEGTGEPINNWLDNRKEDIKKLMMEGGREDDKQQAHSPREVN